MRWSWILVLLVAETAQAIGSWSEPHPWRREALLEGRYFDYDSEAFLHYFNYRHLSDTPGPWQDGLAGTVGSVASDRAFVDFRLRQSLAFEGGSTRFIFQADRGEDFDGAYSRQLVGFSHAPADNWRLAIRGDVHTNKAESDVWFQGEWHGQSATVRAAVILPDAYFNAKTPGDLSYRREPRTFFTQVGLGDERGARMTLTVNHSPAATVVDGNTGLEATGGQTRAQLATAFRSREWEARLTARGESTSRHYDFGTALSPGVDEFDREMHSVGLALSLHGARYRPEFGLYHLRMEEEGWFGRATNSTGEIRRSEPLAWARVTLPGGPRHYWQPAVYVSRPSINQQVESDDWHDRDTRAWRGKIALPWRYVADRDAGATVTVTPSLLLHEFGFGGGNVQVHWPL